MHLIRVIIIEDIIEEIKGVEVDHKKEVIDTEIEEIERDIVIESSTTKDE